SDCKIIDLVSDSSLRHYITPRSLSLPLDDHANHGEHGPFEETFSNSEPLRFGVMPDTALARNKIPQHGLQFSSSKIITVSSSTKTPSNAEIFSRPRSSLSCNFVALDRGRRRSRRTKYSPSRHWRTYLPDCLCLVPWFRRKRHSKDHRRI